MSAGGPKRRDLRTELIRVRRQAEAIACAAPAELGVAPKVEVRRFSFPGSRQAVKWQSAQAALDMLRQALRRPSAPR